MLSFRNFLNFILDQLLYTNALVILVFFNKHSVEADKLRRPNWPLNPQSFTGRNQFFSLDMISDFKYKLKGEKFDVVRKKRYVPAHF